MTGAAFNPDTAYDNIASVFAKSGAFDHIVASDASLEMLDVLCEKLERSSVSYRREWSDDRRLEGTVIQSSWESLSSNPPQGIWDAVICLGFSLPHLTLSERFVAAFRGWRELLRAGGYVLVDFGTNFDLVAASVREGTFRAEPRKWNIEEVRDPAGMDVVIATGRELLRDAGASLAQDAGFEIVELPVARRRTSCRRSRCIAAKTRLAHAGLSRSMRS